MMSPGHTDIYAGDVFADIENSEETLAKTWLTQSITFGFTDEIHVMPMDDSAVHKWDPKCACKPTINKIEFGPSFVTHNAWDAREFLQGHSSVASRQQME